MPKIVELPGNRTVEFPDDFTEDRMNVEILHAFPDLARGGVLEPGIPKPGESASGKIGTPLTAFEAGQIPTMAQQAKESPIPELSAGEIGQAAIETFTQPLVELPVVGEEGSRIRGARQAVSNLVGAMTSPVGLGLSAAIGAAPAIGKVAGPLFGAAGVKSGMQKMGEAGVTGDKEKWWEGFTESLLGAAAFGGETPKAIRERRSFLTQELRAVDAAAREALAITPEKITTTEMPPPQMTMEAVGAGARRVLVPKARELVPTEAEDVFGLGKLTEASNAEIAAATEALKTDAPLTAAELAKDVSEPTPKAPEPPPTAPEAKAPEPTPPAKVESPAATVAKAAAAPRKIVAVASRLGDQVETGNIHFDAETKLRQKLGLKLDDPRVENIEHGFLDNQGNFLGREEAWNVAQAAKQVKAKTEDPGFLGKEDLKKGVLPEKAASPAIVKEPWQMTREEFAKSDYYKSRRAKMRRIKESPGSVQFTLVRQALEEGKQVPPEVLAEYPDLAPKPEAKPAAETAPVAAAAKVEQEVKTVAKTEGQRSAKEVKSELVQSIESELEKTPKYSREVSFGKPRTYNGKKKIEVRPAEGPFNNSLTIEEDPRSQTWNLVISDYVGGTKYPKELRQIIGNNLSLQEAKAQAIEQINAGNPWHLDKSILDKGKEFTPDVETMKAQGHTFREKPATVTIDIPGDGSFTIPKTRYALERILARAKAVETSTKPGKGYSESKPTQAESQQYLKEAEVKPPETPPTGLSVPTPAEQAEIRAELDETLGGKSGVPLKPLPPGAGNLPVKGLHEIIQDLAKGLKLPIRFGRLTTTKFAGYFKPVADLIGSRRANDITTISHEVGHKLDKHLKFSSDRSIAGELDVLGDPATPGSGSSWTKSKSRAYKLGEGVGEFVRYWMTDPADARARAPRTFAAFETAMNANPDFGDVMRTAQGDIQTWRASPSQSRLRSHISIGDNPNKTPYRLRQLTRDLVDDLHILRVAVDDAQRWLGSKLAPIKNPYVLARLLRGAYGRADVFVRHGTVDFKTKAVTLGNSLQDALKPIAGRIDEFRDYIVARRAKEIHSQGRNSGLLDQDIQVTVQRYANDTAFQRAFDAVKEWQDSLVRYARDAGLISDEGLIAMRRMNQDYVPFHRLFEIGAGEISSLESPGLGRGLNLGKPSSLRGLHGSPRPIVDPLETMIKNAYVLTTAAEKQAIHLALADLSSSPGMGKWVEKIATPKEMVKVGIEKIRKQLEDAGADLTGVPDNLLLSFFQNSRQAPFGENIIRIVRNGKPEFYRLDRELFDTFHALDLDDAGQLTKILAAPAQLLRSGVILAPDFALANAFRDAFSSAIVGKYTTFPFEATIRGLAAMLRRPNLVQEWKAAGGANAVEASYFDRTRMQKFMRESITSDLTPMEKAVLIAKGPLTFLRWLTGTAEEATRIGEYDLAYKALRKGGMSEGDARTMAGFESRDRQDFAKGGAKTKILRLWTPFWNAGLQANIKLAQSFRERPFQTTVKGLAFITTAKVIEQALNWDDEDYWDRPQWERDTFFMIPIGKDQAGKTRFLKLPTPFEPGIIFGTLPGRVFQYLRQNDKRAIDGFMQAVAQQTIPNPIPQGIQVIFEDFLSGSKGWDIFRGRQIVPESIADMPVDLQWTEQTSLTARKVGKLIGLSPMKVDHIIASTSGGLGRQLTHNVSDRLIQLTTGEKPTATSQVPGGRFITVPGGIVSQSVEDFYTYFQKIASEENRWKAIGKGKEWAGLATDFRSAAKQMSNLRAASRSTTDPLDKQKYEIQIAEIAKIYAAEARKMGVK